MVIKALNWLLRSVTQTTCLHDLLWWFVAALTTTPVEPEPESKEKDESVVSEIKPDKKEEHVSF